MKKVFKVEDLDCANCAAKMERAIEKIDGVELVSVSFMGQKIVMEIEDGQYDSVVRQMLDVCKKVEPDCRIKVS